MAINVSALGAYVEEKRLPLISKTLMGAKTASMMTLQSGVKSKTALNLLGTEVEFGDGSACGWNEVGETTLSQRFIEPAALKVNMSFCDKALLDKWANYDVRVAAGQKTLPFEEDFVNGVIDSVNEKIEDLIFKGDSTNDNEFDGLVKILTEDGGQVVTFVEGTSAYNKVKEVYTALPAAIKMKDDVVIFVDPADYAEFVQDLVVANLYHFEPEFGDGTHYLPGTRVRVIAASGLVGSRYMVAGRLSNMFYGCDSADDASAFDIWYSKDNREFRLAIEFTAGVQVAYPDEMVVGFED